jgi:hypothetical protein
VQPQAEPERRSAVARSELGQRERDASHHGRGREVHHEVVSALQHARLVDPHAVLAGDCNRSGECFVGHR